MKVDIDRPGVKVDKEIRIPGWVPLLGFGIACYYVGKGSRK